MMHKSRKSSKHSKNSSRSNRDQRARNGPAPPLKTDSMVPQLDSKSMGEYATKRDLKSEANRKQGKKTVRRVENFVYELVRLSASYAKDLRELVNDEMRSTDLKEMALDKRKGVNETWNAILQASLQTAITHEKMCEALGKKKLGKILDKMEDDTSKIKKESKALSKKLKNKTKKMSATETKLSKSREECFKTIKKLKKEAAAYTDVCGDNDQGVVQRMKTSGKKNALIKNVLKARDEFEDQIERVDEFNSEIAVLESNVFNPLLEKRSRIESARLEALSECALLIGKAFSAPLVPPASISNIEDGISKLLSSSQKVNERIQQEPLSLKLVHALPCSPDELVSKQWPGCPAGMPRIPGFEHLDVSESDDEDEGREKRRKKKSKKSERSKRSKLGESSRKHSKKKKSKRDRGEPESTGIDEEAAPPGSAPSSLLTRPGETLAPVEERMESHKSSSEGENESKLPVQQVAFAVANPRQDSEGYTSSPAPTAPLAQKQEQTLPSTPTMKQVLY